MSTSVRLATVTLAAGIAAAVLATPAAAAPPPALDVPATRVGLLFRPPVCDGSSTMGVQCPIKLSPYHAEVI